MLFKIFRKYFIIIIIAILQSNAEYDYFIQKRSWQGTDMKIREILNSQEKRERAYNLQILLPYIQLAYTF